MQFPAGGLLMLAVQQPDRATGPILPTRYLRSARNSQEEVSSAASRFGVVRPVPLPPRFARGEGLRNPILFLLPFW